MNDERVAVIGLGLIGGSLAGALRRAGTHVRGYDIVARHGQIALDRGLVDEVAGGIRQVVDGTSVVVLATPTLRTLDLLPRVDLLAAPDALVLDTASAKRVIVDAMAALPGSGRMIGGHPLAGRETSGPADADPSLFDGRTFCLCPSPATEEVAQERATALVRAIGASPYTLSPCEHDHIIAETSHLPQILATVLAGTVDAVPQLAGSGYRDMTRLAGSDPYLWRDVLLANADEVADAGRRYQARLGALLGAIESADVAGIEQAFLEGREARARMVLP